MSYHIYTTKGLVLQARPSKEADRVYSILTEDFGLVRARASGARKIESKLRGALEPLSFSSISLVRGKEYWRITGAVLGSNMAKELEDKEVLKAFAKSLMLIGRLIAGEESHPRVYKILEEAADFAKSSPSDVLNAEALEIHILINVLHELGYIADEELREGFKKISKEALEEAAKGRLRYINAINAGIKGSGLV